MATQFEKNLSHFERLNADAAVRLSLTKDDHLQFITSEKGEENLLNKKLDLTYHSQLGAYDEALSELPTLKDDPPNVVMFGIGLGYSFLALEEWLKKTDERKLFILEDDLAVISRFLETKTATKLLKNPQVFLFFVAPNEEGKKVLEGIAWSIFPGKVQFLTIPFYQKHRYDDFKKLESRLLYSLEDVHSVLDEYFLYGLPFLRNFLLNIFLLQDSYKGDNLKGKFKNVPAIICGAGPSLTKQLDLLKGLKNKAIIFAGGSAMNALGDVYLQPHFGGGIDPNETQYLRVRNSLSFQIPFFYRSRLFNSAARLITGPLLYLRGGDGYNITDLFEKKANIKGSILGGGHSIANFGIEIAYALGCRPIILIGFDLAYTGEKSYAKGVEETPSLTKNDDDVIERTDFEGKPIKTLWKWVLESEWISEFKKEHKNLNLINATEGGLKISGIPNVTFNNCIKNYLNETFDLDGWIQREIEAAGTISLSSDTIFITLTKLYDSLHRANGLIDTMIDECSKSHDLTSSTAIFTLEKLEKELSYKYILEVFHRMHTKLDFYKLQFLKNPAISSKRQGLEEQKQLLSHYNFLKQVVISHCRMIDKCVERRRLAETDVHAFSPKSKPL